MSRSHRLSEALQATLAARSLDARLQLLSNAASGVILLLAAGALAGQTAFGGLTMASAIAIVLAGTAAAALVIGMAWSVRRSVGRWVDGVALTVDALADGELGITLKGIAGVAPERLDASLRRLSRQLAENSETAHALADGAFRRAARTSAPQDPIGRALAQLTSRMNEVAACTSRIARGDLSNAITPQSPQDVFGLAFAGMARRVSETLREVEATRRAIVVSIESMRGDAAALASSANVDADRLRRTEERLMLVTLQARADAERGALLAERVQEGEVMLAQGALALQASIDGLAGVLRQSEGVQRLARSASLLAVNGTEGQSTADHEDAARALATEAAAVGASITRMMIEGTDQGYVAGVAFDRVSLAMRDGATLMHELEASACRHAVELCEIDTTVSQVTRTTANSAETARQLVSRLDAVSTRARRLETVIRKLGQASSPVQAAAGLPARPGIGAIFSAPVRSQGAVMHM